MVALAAGHSRRTRSAFDSVIVIWQPTVIDQTTNEVLWIGTAAGLTPAMGTAQAYTTLIIEAATLYGHLNVFKHEWGHSLLDYYEAARTAPMPTVTNHTDGNQYVNCVTGQMYGWRTKRTRTQSPTRFKASGFGGRLPATRFAASVSQRRHGRPEGP